MMSCHHHVLYFLYSIIFQVSSDGGRVLTVSPGRGLSWPSMTDILASWSSLLSVCTVLRAESISKGPQASWAFKQHIPLNVTQMHSSIMQHRQDVSIYRILAFSKIRLKRNQAHLSSASQRITFHRNTNKCPASPR